jgi:hypothetical protein
VTHPDPNVGAAPELSVAAFSDAETIDLVESWLRADPDLRLGKVRAQGQRLRLAVTRRQFWEAKRRIGITASAAPHPGHRRAGETRAATPVATVEAPVPADSAPAPPKAETHPRRRRSRRPINLAQLADLAENLEAIVAERDRARAALEEIARIVKALR